MKIQRPMRMVLGAAGLAAAWVSAQAAADELEITGAVANLSGACPDLRFTLGAQEVATDARTEFDDGACPRIRHRERVQVAGTMAADGTLVAAEVELESPDHVSPEPGAATLTGAAAPL